jgi:hypothetical protein
MRNYWRLSPLLVSCCNDAYLCDVWRCDGDADGDEDDDMDGGDVHEVNLTLEQLSRAHPFLGGTSATIS